MGVALDIYLRVWPDGEISKLAHAAIMELIKERDNGKSEGDEEYDA